MKENLTLLIYKGLDWLKQESPFWWAVVQSLLWASFGIISTHWIDFKGEEVVLVFLGGLISSVGTRTTKKLGEHQQSIKVEPEQFKTGVAQTVQNIESLKENFKINKDNKSSGVIKKILPSSQYVNKTTNKDSIVLHHTAGGDYKGTVAWWLSKSDRVATHFLIERDGTIIQTVPLENWAYHLYVGSKENKVSSIAKKKDEWLNQKSISIEICSYGQLKKKDDKYFNLYGKEVKEVDVLDYSFRGETYFEKYTTEQIASLKNLLEMLHKDFNIPYSPLTFTISEDALSGKPGIYTHVNYRTDNKWDCYPNKELIEMLNSLL